MLEPTGHLLGRRLAGQEGLLSVHGAVFHRRVRRVVSLHSSRTVPDMLGRKLLLLHGMLTRTLEMLR